MSVQPRPAAERAGCALFGPGLHAWPSTQGNRKAVTMPVQRPVQQPLSLARRCLNWPDGRALGTLHGALLLQSALSLRGEARALVSARCLTRSALHAQNEFCCGSIPPDYMWKCGPRSAPYPKNSLPQIPHIRPAKLNFEPPGPPTEWGPKKSCGVTASPTVREPLNP